MNQPVTPRGVGRFAGRVVIVVAGVAMGLGAGFFALIVASTAECENALRTSNAWVCTGVWRVVLAWAEGALVGGALLGPLVGAIASARGGRLRWIVIGGVIAFVCVAVQIGLAEQQKAVVS